MSGQPIRTLSTGYALTSIFVPGDRHIIIGTKVQIIIGSSTVYYKKPWYDMIEVYSFNKAPELGRWEK